MSVEFKWLVSRDQSEIEAHYLQVIPAVTEAAKSLGYAVAVHGSKKRDLDLIAVPWVETFSPPDELAKAISLAACGAYADFKKVEKPHNRLAYVIHIGTTAYIDLSIINPTKKERDEN